MPITIGDPQPRLVLVTFAGAVSAAEFDRYLRALDQRLQAARRTAVVLDTRLAPSVGHDHARTQGEWMRQRRAALQATTAALAFIVSQAAHRFLLSSIFLIQRPPAPHVVTASLDEGLAFCRQHLAPRA